MEAMQLVDNLEARPLAAVCLPLRKARTFLRLPEYLSSGVVPSLPVHVARAQGSHFLDLSLTELLRHSPVPPFSLPVVRSRLLC